MRRDDDGEQLAVVRKGIHRILDGRLLAQNAVIAHEILFAQDVLAGKGQQFFQHAPFREQRTHRPHETAVVDHAHRLFAAVHGQVGIVALGDLDERLLHRLFGRDTRHLLFPQLFQARRA